MTEPTETERRNGWTDESLAKYLRARNQAARDAVLKDKEPPLKIETVKTFNPNRW